MVSIVMAYRDRKNHLWATLESIAKSSVKDKEVIIVNDRSIHAHFVYDAPKYFPFVQIIDVTRMDHYNPCVPYNRGFRVAQGDIIVIQNPECFHVGDVLSHVVEHMTEDSYLTYSCYSLGSKDTSCLQRTSDPTKISLFDGIPDGFGDGGWFNHPIHRPSAYHFCSAMTTKNLRALGGFDERYAYGMCYDDDEFLSRVRRMGLRVEVAAEPYVLHQKHNKIVPPHINELVEKNRKLYEEVTLRETTWDAGPIK